MVGLHQIPAGNVYILGTTTNLIVNAVSSSGVVVTLEKFFLGLGLTVT